MGRSQGQARPGRQEDRESAILPSRTAEAQRSETRPCRAPAAVPTGPLRGLDDGGVLFADPTPCGRPVPTTCFGMELAAEALPDRRCGSEGYRTDIPGHWRLGKEKKRSVHVVFFFGSSHRQNQPELSCSKSIKNKIRSSCPWGTSHLVPRAALGSWVPPPQGEAPLTAPVLGSLFP